MKGPQRVIGDYLDMTIGTDVIANPDIIEHQHIDGVETPIL